MDEEPTPQLLEEATAAYRLVVANPEAAGPEVARLTKEARQLGDHRTLVAALRAEAWYERSRLDHERAGALLDEAVRLARRHRLQPQWRDVLTTRGAIRHEQGRLAAARHDFEQAGAFLGDGDDPELDSQCAALYQNTGRLREAATMYRRILSRPEAPADVRAKAANNLGLIEVWNGRAEVGLGWFEVAAAAAVEVGPGPAAFVAEGRAWATVKAGRLAEGLELFDDAAAQWAAVGMPLAELYAEYADALLDLRLIPEAEREAQRAVVSLEQHGFALIAAEAQLRLARLRFLRGDLVAAAEEADIVAARLRGHGRAVWAARARLVTVDAHLAGVGGRPGDLGAARRAATTLERSGLAAEAVDAWLSTGRVAAARGRATAARASWARAWQLAQSAPLLVRMKGRVGAALAATVDDDARRVVRHCRGGLADLARHRAALPSAELRALASGHGSELGSIGLAAVVRTRSAAEVLHWMERTRAAALAVVDPPSIEGIEEELGLLRSLQADIAVERRDGGAAVTELLGRQAAVEERIRRATWRHHTGGDAPDRTRRASELRIDLAGQVLVEYDVLDGDIVAVVVGPRHTRLLHLGPLEPVRRDVLDLVFALRRLARVGRSTAALAAAKESADDTIAELRQRLVAPLAIDRPESVVVVPVGVLQRVPWAALHDVPVAVAPSATLWARTNERPAPSTDAVALIAGPELPGAIAEVEALAAIHPGAEVLLPPRSDIASVAAALARASLAHLACHGTVRADNAMFSSLLVSDGSLTVHELDRRGVAPHRVVLAACESSSDASYPGNETLGFVSTMLALGTSGLVASSVVIPDWDVAPVMVELHRSLRAGRPSSVALHDARASIERDDPSGLVSWCAFNAFGAA